VGQPKLFIDARIGGKQMTMFALTDDEEDNNARAQYNSALDGESEELPCGSKATAYTTDLAAGYVSWTIAQYLQGLPFARMVDFNGGFAQTMMLGIRNQE
jgi:hypothetical protein